VARPPFFSQGKASSGKMFKTKKAGVDMPTQKQKIIDQLKTEILSLDLKPGTIISEASLTERFHLSRTPIRDILKQLSLEGYINIYPQRGSLVSYIDLESVENIIYLRNTLEKEIASDLCGQLSLKGQHSLKQILLEQKKCITEDKAFNNFMPLDDAFHQTLFDLAGRSFLWEIIQQFNVDYMRYRKLHMLKESKLLEIYKEHENLLKLLLQGDTKSIKTLLDHHIRSDVDSTNFSEQFLGFIKELS
jgi:DNA-binding GntR family transcriptional regulator